VLVCVDESAASDAAVTWGTREAIMRQLPKIFYSNVVATLIDASKDAWMVAKGWATSRYCSAQVAFVCVICVICAPRVPNTRRARSGE
jgi:hypothetical protein